jgi:chorismate dehydratase
LRSSKLRIGRIPYANLYPVFYYLDRKCDCSSFIFTAGVPSRLNRLLREGRLDVSPSSSVEFLRNRDKYRILPSFSISASGPIDSILLFSNSPIEKLGGKVIAASFESETSVALLNVILREFYSLRCRIDTVRRRSVTPLLSEYPAVLLIGDSAMMESKKAGRNITSGTDGRPDPVRIDPARSSPIFVYDLGQLWNTFTGLPFVFALWIATNDAVRAKKALLRKLSDNLAGANSFVEQKLALIATDAPYRGWLTEEELVHYWKKLSFNLTERHMEALGLFEKYIRRH